LTAVSIVIFSAAVGGTEYAVRAVTGRASGGRRRARHAHPHDYYREYDEDDANTEAAEQAEEKRVTSARRLSDINGLLGRLVAIDRLLGLDL